MKEKPVVESHKGEETMGKDHIMKKQVEEEHV
jgi:hypothetical protein